MRRLMGMLWQGQWVFKSNKKLSTLHSRARHGQQLFVCFRNLPKREVDLWHSKGKLWVTSTHFMQLSQSRMAVEIFYRASVCVAFEKSVHIPIRELEGCRCSWHTKKEWRRFLRPLNSSAKCLLIRAAQCRQKYQMQCYIVVQEPSKNSFSW